jgi:hypothetical protein
MRDGNRRVIKRRRHRRIGTMTKSGNGVRSGRIARQHATTTRRNRRLMRQRRESGKVTLWQEIRTNEREGGRRRRESEETPFTVVVLELMEEGERRAKRERKGAEGGPLLARGVEDFGSREGTGSCGRPRRRRGGGSKSDWWVSRGRGSRR